MYAQRWNGKYYSSGRQCMPWCMLKGRIKIGCDTLRIWTTIFPWCTVLFARGRLSMESPVGVWYSIVPLCYLVCCACPPHPPCLQRTLIPFSVRPQRHIQHCLKCCKWDTEPHSPNKGGVGKNNRIMGLNLKMNILLYSHGLVSKQQWDHGTRKSTVCLSTCSLSHVDSIYIYISSCFWAVKSRWRYTSAYR